MAGSQVQQNLIPNNPEMKDLLDLFKKNLLLNLNCHHIGTVKLFDPVTQTASATVNYQKTFFNFNATTGTYDPVLVPYPVLLDCPVICLGGGDGVLTFPIEPGDECLVFFNDRDLDNWFQGGGSGGAVSTPRLHSFSDGLILVGVRSLANVVPGYNPTGAEFRNKDGSSRLTVAANGDITMTTAFGFFTFKANSDVVFDTGTVQGLFGHGGHVKFENSFGELIDALYTLFTTATAGGFPLITDPVAIATLQSFIEP